MGLLIKRGDEGIGGRIIMEMMNFRKDVSYLAILSKGRKGRRGIYVGSEQGIGGKGELKGVGCNKMLIRIN